MSSNSNISKDGTIASVTSHFSPDNWSNKSFYDVLYSMFDTPHCDKMDKINHAYFQLANIFFLLSYFAPNGRFGTFYLRCMLLIGYALFAVWGIKVLCSADILIWNSTFIICNLVHIVILLTKVWPSKFSKDIEDLYVELFQPLKVSRKQFQKLLKCIKSIKILKYQDIYAQEKVTRVEYLSVVLSGKLVISQQNRALHIVFPHQFLDSPEWFGVSTDDFFQVSITAMEDSRILLWHRDKLKLSIIRDKFLQTVLEHILSRDVVNKLMQVNDMSGATINGNFEDDTLCDNKSLMIVKKSGDSNGITALLSRQLQVHDMNAWRLGKIDEVDFETSV